MHRNDKKNGSDNAMRVQNSNSNDHNEENHDQSDDNDTVPASKEREEDEPKLPTHSESNRAQRMRDSNTRKDCTRRMLCCARGAEAARKIK